MTVQVENSLVPHDSDSFMPRGDYWLSHFLDITNSEKKEISPGVRAVYELIEAQLVYSIQHRNVSHLHGLSKDEKFQAWVYGQLTKQQNEVEIIETDNYQTDSIIDPKIATRFQNFLESTIGERGYIRQYYEDRGLSNVFAKDAAALVIALIVSAYGHHEQFRGTGEPYALHPLFVAQHAGWRHKLPARDLITSLCHDLLEDSKKPRKKQNTKGEIIEQKGYPVTFDNLIQLFNEDIADDVEGLTYVRKAHKINGKEVKDKTATQLKIIEATLHRPSLIAIKIYDQLQNAMTLKGKKNDADRVAIASTMLQVYVPLARLFGMNFEADVLEDICWPFVDEATYKDGFSTKVTAGLSAFEDRVGRGAPDNIKSMVESYFDGEFYGVETRFPFAFEIAEKTVGRKITDEDMYIDVMIVLPQRMRFASDAMDTISYLLSRSEIGVPYDDDVGSDAVLARINRQIHSGQIPVQEGVFQLVYTDEHKSVPLKVRIMEYEHYMMTLSPITNLVARDIQYLDLEHWAQLTTDQRSVWANRRLSQLNEDYGRCIDSGMSDKEIVDHFLESKGETIIVYGTRQIEKKNEVFATPIARGMTLADYMCLKLGTRSDKFRMTWVKSVTINGEQFVGRDIDQVIDRVLEQGDTIHCEYTNRERPDFISLKWIKSLTIKNPEIRQQLNEHIWRIIKEGNDKTNMLRELAITGLEEMDRQVSGTSVLGVQKLEDIYPADVISGEELAAKIALGLINGEELRKIYERMSILTEKIERWSVTGLKGDESGVLASVTNLAQELGLSFELFESNKPFGEANVTFYVLSDEKWEEFEKKLGELGWSIRKDRPYKTS